MNIVILDYITLGEDLDLSPASRFGTVIKYETSTQDEAKIRVKDADIIIADENINIIRTIKKGKTIYEA